MPVTDSFYNRPGFISCMYSMKLVTFLKAGLRDPIFSLALFQLIEMLIRISNFFEFE